MKVNLRTIIGILGGVVMASCSTTIDEQTPIQFGTAVSRAAVNDEKGLSSFSVWGGYQGVEDLFDATLVDKNGTYSDGTRYWIPGKTFNFYAVHPATLPEGSVADVTDVAGNGTITVTGFDCSKTGAEAVDLMTATAQRTTSNPIKADEVAAVPFQFSHELSRVNVYVKTEESNVTIKSISLINAGYIGNFSNGTWAITSKSNESFPATFSKSNIQLNSVETEENVFGDMLLLPLSETDFDSKIKIEYSYLYNEQSYDSGLKEISLKTATVKSWDKGGNYKYTITIPRFTEELKLEVSVLPWNKVDDAYVEW